MLHPTDHEPQWVYGDGDDEGRTWCGICKHATFDMICVVCGQTDDEATVLHGTHRDYELHRPVYV